MKKNKQLKIQSISGKNVKVLKPSEKLKVKGGSFPWVN